MAMTLNSVSWTWQASNSMQQQYIEKNHLSASCTSLAWYRPASAGAGGKRKHSSDNAATMGLVAVGMDNGTTSVWDLQRGVVTIKLGKDQHLAAVTDVAFSADGA